MEFLENENAQLKELIRVNDNRIQYLETRLRHLANMIDPAYCHTCSTLCDYDEEKCDCNMFCTNHLCRICVVKKQTKYYCNYSRCKKWFCELDGKYSSALVCLECKKVFCQDHAPNATNICEDCHTIQEYDYCEK